jgi:hypothetical protein
VAYPFTYFNTWRELINLLEKDHNITFQETEEVADAQGTASPIQYFEHKTADRTFRYVVCFDDENERPLPSVLRSLCAGLRLSPKFLGLDLE